MNTYVRTNVVLSNGKQQNFFQFCSLNNGKKKNAFSSATHVLVRWLYSDYLSPSLKFNAISVSGREAIGLPGWLAGWLLVEQKFLRKLFLFFRRWKTTFYPHQSITRWKKSSSFSERDNERPDGTSWERDNNFHVANNDDDIIFSTFLLSTNIKSLIIHPAILKLLLIRLR